jgi:hypothetical protein
MSAVPSPTSSSCADLREACNAGCELDGLLAEVRSARQRAIEEIAALESAA